VLGAVVKTVLVLKNGSRRREKSEIYKEGGGKKYIKKPVLIQQLFIGYLLCANHGVGYKELDAGQLPRLPSGRISRARGMCRAT